MQPTSRKGGRGRGLVPGEMLGEGPGAGVGQAQARGSGQRLQGGMSAEQGREVRGKRLGSGGAESRAWFLAEAGGRPS